MGYTAVRLASQHAVNTHPVLTHLASAPTTHSVWADVSFLSFVLIEVSYLPQIFRLHRMKEAHEFHLLYPLLNTFGRVLGLLAGVEMHRQDITAGFALGVVVRLVLLGQVFYYRRAEERRKQISIEGISV